MLKNKKKKKKGFTLIELVIVLAVLAIIALIAIPNFTKVRNDSLLKADQRTAEQIEKITLMAIANEDIIVNKTTDIKLIMDFNDDKSFKEVRDDSSLKGDGYEKSLSEVKKPQVNGRNSYLVEIKTDASVDVKYGDGTVIDENAVK